MNQTVSTYTTIRYLQRKVFNFLAVCLGLLALVSCKKESELPGTASLSIVNGVVGSSSLVTNFSNAEPVIYYNANRVYYNRFAINPTAPYNNLFNSYSGIQQLTLFEYPDTTDKSIPLLNLTLDLPVGSIQTLFLTGTVDAPDMMITKDTLPFYPASDSAMGIRFINLSPGSGPVSVNIVGNPNGSEQRSLSYKEITRFNTYPVLASLDDYVFEFRDVATGALIASYTTEGINNPGLVVDNFWVYCNFTFALLGTPGGVGAEAQTVLLIQHNY